MEHRMTLAKLGEFSGYSPRTLKYWIECGYLKPTAVSQGKYFYTVDNLLEAERLSVGNPARANARLNASKKNHAQKNSTSHARERRLASPAEMKAILGLPTYPETKY